MAQRHRCGQPVDLLDRCISGLHRAHHFQWPAAFGHPGQSPTPLCHCCLQGESFFCHVPSCRLPEQGKNVVRCRSGACWALAKSLSNVLEINSSKLALVHLWPSWMSARLLPLLTFQHTSYERPCFPLTQWPWLSFLPVLSCFAPG